MMKTSAPRIPVTRLTPRGMYAPRCVIRSFGGRGYLSEADDRSRRSEVFSGEPVYPGKQEYGETHI